MTLLKALALALPGVVITACTKQYEPEPALTPASGLEPTAASGSPIAAYAPEAQISASELPDTESRETATGALIQARCTHQKRCVRIGPSLRFSNWQACLDVEGIAVRAHMSGCIESIPMAALNTCLQDILLTSCESKSDSIARVESCEIGQLCGE